MVRADGRRLYELMAVWETDPEIIEQSAQNAEFARIWQRAEKIVYSRTLTRVRTQRTRLRARFDPAEVELIKADAPGDLAIEGPTLAAEAFRHQLVDAVMVFLCPVVLGGGRQFWPERRLDLALRRERRFDSGTIQLRYDVLTV